MHACRGQKVNLKWLPQLLNIYFLNQAVSFLSGAFQIQLDKLANKPQGSSCLHPQYWDYKHDSPCPALFRLRQLSFCVTLAVLELAM